MSKEFKDVKSALKEVLNLEKSGKKDEALVIIKELQELSESIERDVKHFLAYAETEETPLQSNSEFLSELMKLKPNFSPTKAKENPKNPVVEFLKRKRGDC